MDPAQQPAQVMHIMAALVPMFFMFGIVMMAVLIFPLWRIASKAGLPGPLALLAILPGVGLLLALYIIAFSEWKVMPLAMYPPPMYPPVTPPQYAPPAQAYVPPAQPHLPPTQEPPTGV